jgi:hypothetical protein
MGGTRLGVDGSGACAGDCCIGMGAESIIGAGIPGRAGNPIGCGAFIGMLP